jgi:transcriptional regulator with XRE-family HTH domain
METTEYQRHELAEFLRSRRARLRPEDVGLPSGGRRRTPGLRREEVAALAAVSPTWYTWLEQGRDVRASHDVLASLANVLQLSEIERAHLHLLARNEPVQVTESTTDAIVALLDGIDSPGYVRDHSWNLLGWNASASCLFGDFGSVGAEPPNLLRYLFTDPAAKRVFVDWSEVAARSVAQFRRHAAKSPDTEATAQLVDSLSEQSSEFRRFWDAFAVQPFFVGTCLLRHEAAGQLSFHYATLAYPDGAPPWVTLFTPIGDIDRGRLLQLLGRES